ncbi:MAG: GntR family transcriptional regulator [Rhodospirillaceae bacterium]|nr:GntR family transcriptional regulator [Rhodospirillaceae bacterium]
MAEEDDGMEQVSRGEFVHARLRDAIKAGRYPPGTRVRETEVAAWLNVSRTPVREALRRLQADGLLVFEPWRGVVVAELDQQQIVEFYAMRRVLDGAAARLAAQHASEPELAYMEDCLTAAAPSRGDADLMAEANRKFHDALFQAAHNRYLLKSAAALSDALALLRGTTYSFPDRAETAHQEHRALMDAIRAREPDKAERLARKHIAKAEKARLKLLGDQREERQSEDKAAKGKDAKDKS